MRCFYFILFFTALGLPAVGQKYLQVVFTRLGVLKTYEVPVGQTLEYKIKGSHRFQKDTIYNLQDSLVIFNGRSITLGQIKRLRIRTNNYHNKLFQTIFLIGAVGYPLLNVTNNAINDNSPLLDQKAVIVSGSFLAASLLTRELGIKRLRINKHKALKVVDIDFNRLNSK